MALITLSNFTHHGMAGCAYNIITLSSPSALPSSSLDISMTGKVWKMSNQLSVTLCFVFLSIPVVLLLVLQTFTKKRLSSSLSRFLDKVQIFSEGHKNLAHFHSFFDIVSNYKWKMCQIFVNFSEYLNFTYLIFKYHPFW